MAIFTPDILRSTLFPSFFVYRFLGMGVIESSVGRRRWVLNLIYFSTICISYLIALFLSHDMVGTISQRLGSSIAGLGFSIYRSLSCLMIIANLVNDLLHNKEHNHCVSELMTIDTTIREMGAVPLNQPPLKQRISQFLGSLVVCIMMLVSDLLSGLRENKSASIYSIVSFSYVFDGPVLLSIFSDIAFYVFNRAITHSFEDLNSLLQSAMTTNLSDCHDTITRSLIRREATLEDKNKLEKLRCIRKIYFRLVDLAKYWVKLNELHVLSSTIFAIWMGTYRTYQLQHLFFEDRIISPNLVEKAQCVKEIICHIVKIYLVQSSAGTLAAEARRTSRILLTYLQPVGFLRVEVNEFTLQIIQYPLRLSAAGLFDLDYTLMQMVITSVATYSVVLLQSRGL